ncbi:FHA domain protein [Porphyromonas crevioricanis JCM 15906]|uniref:FHA domain protein n=1 Tax=Porphyromonas crevioricanis JCM 15906 TaxID=1305617 RepID=T1CHN8_9PORP|nr:FHA domain-containing protein [Porphyromonas crevioricanis]GAD05456.1 FHA domain protein [Porphyromonas crevioricanis JCM 15906]SJZ88749.1 FHA domain-containing protein [Porphyromonas crevioricanis]
MKRIRCPYCDQLIVLSNERIKVALSQEGRLSLVCSGCKKQIKARIRPVSAEKLPESSEPEGLLAPAAIFVVENAFAYKQTLKFGPGVHSIGRKNKDTQIDLPIQTSDPSMDRHHCLLKVQVDSDGNWSYAIKDDESRVGTFIAGRCLSDREWFCLNETTVITLGATSLIFEPHPDENDQTAQ